VGKTNLLDAIHYLCFTKSYFTNSDQQNVRAGSTGFRIQANLSLDREYQLICIQRETGKEFILDGENYDRFSAHIGRFPCVIIAPDDTRTITEGSGERRRYMDTLFSQLDSSYLQALILYNRLLQQRNRFLKNQLEKKIPDPSLLEVYDAQMIPAANYIFTKRLEFFQSILPMVQTFNLRISAKEEEIELTYSSQLQEDSFEALLARSRDKDIQFQRTHAGIHKDDLDIRLKGEIFRNIASQGQRKSLLFSLKLAEYEILKRYKGFAPLLLLDDVFEKLDRDRMNHLLAWVGLQDQGQIFITDTHSERIRQHLEQVSTNNQLIEL
jgi:DNA replication and repair protein RecF